MSYEASLADIWQAVVYTPIPFGDITTMILALLPDRGRI